MDDDEGFERKEATVSIGNIVDAMHASLRYNGWSEERIEQFKNAPKQDLDEVGRKYLEDAKRSDRNSRFEYVVGDEYLSSDWDHPSMLLAPDSIEAVLKWNPENKKGLLAAGPTGRGKTRSIMALLYRLMVVDGRDVHYAVAQDWFHELAQQESFGRDLALPWIRKQAAYDIFFLDDLGQEAVVRSKEDWAMGWFFRFLDMRRAKGLPLICTTNLSATQICGSSKSSEIRTDPLLCRLLDLCDMVHFLTVDEKREREKRIQKAAEAKKKHADLFNEATLPSRGGG